MVGHWSYLVITIPLSCLRQMSGIAGQPQSISLCNINITLPGSPCTTALLLLVSIDRPVCCANSVAQQLADGAYLLVLFCHGLAFTQFRVNFPLTLHACSMKVAEPVQ